MTQILSPIVNRTTDVVDFHCHLLPNFDDGPATMDESVEMARLLARAGYEQVYCTPHLIKGVYNAGNDAVRRGVEELQRVLDMEGVDLRLFPGREHYLDEFLPEYLNDPLTLGDRGLLLVELPTNVQEDLVKSTLFRVRQKGFTPLIAHPERSRLLELPEKKRSLKGILGLFFGSNPGTQDQEPAINSLLAYLQEIGCLFQGNLGSFAGYYGSRVRASAERMREMGLYCCFGSDGHNVEGLKMVLTGMGAGQLLNRDIIKQ